MLARFECPYCHKEGWAEVEVHGIEREIFESMEAAQHYVLNKARIPVTYQAEEIYRDVAHFTAQLIQEGRYSKKQLAKEVSNLFGIAGDDALEFLENVKIELGAYEDEGVVCV